jgi:hypothetical protein
MNRVGKQRGKNTREKEKIGRAIKKRDKIG